MNALDVLGVTSSARKAPVRDPRPTTRSQSAKETDEQKEVSRQNREKFAALLALLSSSNQSVRSELLRRLPDGDVSILDQLLNEGEPGISGSNASSDPASTLRYSMLAALNGSDGTQSAAAGSSMGGTTSEIDAKSALLMRASSKRSTGVEELLARGDTDGAELKRALDALLDRAGIADGSAASAGSLSNTGIPALEQALAAARAHSTGDVTTPDRNMESLAPDFRQRLGRVIERMKSEHGHTVDIVETSRSQERQDHLYAQGRTRSGPVVTWTRNSAHTSGNAVDVQVDGSWNNETGYANLQRIAREEGLRTLGMRDPGHLEMAREGASSNVSSTMSSAATSAMQIGAGTATASGIASVAAIAQVATTAQIAQAGSVQTNTAQQGANLSQAALAAQSVSQSDGGSASHGKSSQRESGEGERGSSSDANAAAVLGARTGGGTSGDAQAPTEARTIGPDTFDRAMEAQRLRDGGPARPVSQLKLEVDAPDGGRDQITIGMRGKSVDTSIVTDNENAGRLRMKAGELQDALSKHGLEAESVRITGTARPENNDVGKIWSAVADRDAARVGVAQQSQQGDSASGQNQRDRSASTHDWQDEQEARRGRENNRQGGQDNPRRGPFN